MSHKVSSCEVIVVGGGVIGAACARAAALRGLQVALCEPGPDAAAGSGPGSQMATRKPRNAAARAQAAPMIPPPATKTSQDETLCDI